VQAPKFFYAASKASSPIIITTPEPPAVMDAYVITKLLNVNYNVLNIHVVINTCSTEEEGITAFENLRNAVAHFLGADITCLSLFLIRMKFVHQ